jgi:hypothetical protein
MNLILPRASMSVNSDAQRQRLPFLPFQAAKRRRMLPETFVRRSRCLSGVDLLRAHGLSLLRLSSRVASASFPRIFVQSVHTNPAGWTNWRLRNRDEIRDYLRTFRPKKPEQRICTFTAADWLELMEAVLPPGKQMCAFREYDQKSGWRQRCWLPTAQYRRMMWDVRARFTSDAVARPEQVRLHTLRA